MPLEDQLLALEELRQEGKLDLIGLSNVDRARATRALELVDLAGIQNGYSIMGALEIELDDADLAALDRVAQRDGR